MGGLFGKNNIERGLLIKYRRRDGVLGKTALTFFYLETEQGVRGKLDGALAGGSSGHGGGRGVGQNGEELKGVQFPYLARAGAA